MKLKFYSIKQQKIYKKVAKNTSNKLKFKVAT